MSEEKNIIENKSADTEQKKVFKRILQGKVVSDKNNKTITVLVERQVAHPLYQKYFKMSKKMTAHDENNECNIGDTVRIKESRPLSKSKRWVLIDIVERAK
ncbi:30S ribosomal protein S17 [Candidatus Kapabacteria bacterium]|nr:30S ribosomal protein S17 [Candidatus Kapabacteria bacterium]